MGHTSVVDAEKHQEEKLGKLQGFQTRHQKRVVVVFGRQKGTASRQERDCPATQHVATGTRVESCLRRREGVDPESGCQQERDCPATNHGAAGTRVESCLGRREGGESDRKALAGCSRGSIVARAWAVAGCSRKPLTRTTKC